MLGAKLCCQLDSVFHQPAHAFQSGEGGCEQAALLGVSPKEIHDLVILDRHAEEVVPDVPVQRDEPGEPVHAAAHATGNVGKVSLRGMEGLWSAVRPILGLSLPDVIIFIEARIQEDTVVPRQFVPGPEDEHVHQQRTGGT